MLFTKVCAIGLGNGMEDSRSSTKPNHQWCRWYLHPPPQSPFSPPLFFLFVCVFVEPP